VAQSGLVLEQLPRPGWSSVLRSQYPVDGRRSTERHDSVASGTHTIGKFLEFGGSTAGRLLIVFGIGISE